MFSQKNDSSTNASQDVLNWVNETLLQRLPNDINHHDEAIAIVKKTQKLPRESDFQQTEGPGDAFDAEMAKLMNGMSLEERERTYEEIHGVAPPIPETIEFLEEKLRHLHAEIEDYPKKPKAYLLAVSKSREYIMSEKFGLIFLRAELFDAKKAAVRLLLFLEKKMEFFGEETLGRGLLLSDLTEDDRKTLEAGSVQVLPYKDRSGRIVFFSGMFTGDRLYVTPEAHFKACWYLFITSFEEDEEAQRRGAVVIMWDMDYLRIESDVGSKWVKEVYVGPRWFPFRVNCGHICIDNHPAKQFWARFTIAANPPEIRNNVRIHQGTPTEVYYRLMSFGIPVTVIPANDEGRIKRSHLKKYIAMRNFRDSKVLAGEAFCKQAIPGNTDILFGKGEIIMRHVGNQNFRMRVEMHLNEFLESWRREKTEITWRLLREIERDGGRFLKRDDYGWWEVASDAEARVKIGKTFVDMKRRRNLALERRRDENSDRKRLCKEEPMSSLSKVYRHSDREVGCCNL